MGLALHWQIDTKIIYNLENVSMYIQTIILQGHVGVYSN